MKVLIWPSLSEIKANNGIGRVVYAQYKHLPKYGIELTNDPDQADIIACHTQQYNLPRVDVLHCHGMYWSGDPKSGTYNAWHHRANMEVARASRKARRITVPSAWVAVPYQRDMRLTPLVIGHGLDLEEWGPGENGGYVLWNKNRPGDVCDPTPAVSLAARGIQVVSTFSKPGLEQPETLLLTGGLSAEEMRKYIVKADIYLASVKETFGIGTLEALASGVPVLGFNWGGTATLVKHKETGYLVDPYDYDALLEGVSYIRENRERLSQNAMVFAQGYSWEKVIEQYANLYREVLDEIEHENTKVSVVITNYNYGQYVIGAINSVKAQTIPCEIVVVDDGSTDTSLENLKSVDGIKIVAQSNQGVSAARTAGIRVASGEYIICLDADDKLHPQYADILRTAMLEERELGIAYTGLSLLGPDGTLSPNGWPPAFDWAHMVNVSNPPSSCIPSAAMFRKEMWRRAGPHKQEYAPGEDTEFWVRGLSVGFNAKQVTTQGLFHYRSHAGSASKTKKYRFINDWLPWMIDHHYPFAAPSRTYMPVRSYSQPLVSVIIPVGPEHARHLPAALDSLLGQTFRNWEVVVVWDSDERVDLRPYPFIRSYATRHKGPGAARNEGLRHARGQLSLFLDADDLLHPYALARMIQYYAAADGRYIYPDWQRVEDGVISTHGVPDYSPYSQLTAPQHGVTVLISTEQARAIRFDEKLGALEDWDFFVRCAVSGYHGYHVAEPLLITRRFKKSRTVEASKSSIDWFGRIRKQYMEYAEGTKQMSASCGSCGDGGNAIMSAKQALGFLDVPAERGMMALDVGPNKVRVKFIGEATGASTYGGSGITPSGQSYVGGNNAFDRYADAEPSDVEWLENTGKWERVSLAAPAPVAPMDLEAEVTTPVLTFEEPEPAVVEEPKKEKVKSGRGRKASASRDSGDSGNV